MISINLTLILAGLAYVAGAITAWGIIARDEYLAAPIDPDLMPRANKLGPTLFTPQSVASAGSPYMPRPKSKSRGHMHRPQMGNPQNDKR